MNKLQTIKKLSLLLRLLRHKPLKNLPHFTLQEFRNMEHQAKSVRAFIGAKDFEVARNFYRDLGFQEFIISKRMSYFKIYEALGFYLQDAYVEDWVNNSMIFLEVDNVEQHWKELQNLGLPDKYKDVKLTPIRYEDWGREYFLHDPSGILWHFGEFNKQGE